ncbi:MAG: energy-coupled thiamine transporter ThiT [Clostridia bacterium]|nr:energy-coupled thiamine transporter ThiT [Clostridia bacterium]
MSTVNLNRTEKTKRLALSGIFIALATVLSFIKVFEWPFGGSITACSMLPLAMLAYTYGTGWGLLCGFVHGILQAVLGATMSQAFAGQNAGSVIAIIIIDYLVAFSVIGFAGMLKGKIKNHTAAFTLGTVIGIFMRYIAHVVSGYIFYRSYADWFFGEIMVNDFSAMLTQKCNPELLGLIYSIIYNAAYMIPELIITCIAAAIVISAIKPVRREMTRLNRTEK